MDTHPHVTSNTPIFISEELRTLLESLGTKRTMYKNTYLFHQGIEAKELYLISSGLVKISMISSEGEEMTLRLCKSGDIIGELTLFADEPTYFLNATVIESGQVYVINIDTLQVELMKNSALSIEMMKWFSTHMRKFQTKIRDLFLNGKRGALFSTLIRLSNSYGIKQENEIVIDIPLTNQQLANFCGATREYVNRRLNELKRLDVIDTNDCGKILIKDLDYLKTENRCEKCPIEICTIN